MARAQYYIRGDVRNEKNEIINGARLFVHSSRADYYSGAYGGFGIPVKTLKDTFTISLEGYITLVRPIITDSWQSIVLKTNTILANTSTANSLSTFTRNMDMHSSYAFSLGDESYFQLIENKFVTTANYSTTGFSLGINKASYSNVRRFINMGSQVPPDAVKLEEMLNYFNLCYNPPKDTATFCISSQVSDCPWEKNDRLLYLNISAKKLNLDQIPPGNFIFLIDVSGSMDMPNRLPLLKAAFQMFVKNLRPQDKVSIVTYGGTVGIYLQPTAGSEKEKILTAIEALNAAGDTPGESAIRTAYDLASRTFIVNGNNRIILATDGDFNVGEKSEKALDELVSRQRQTGVYLTCLGVGMGNLKDSKLQILAKKGNGNYAYLDDVQEAEKVLVKELTQTMYAVANNAFINLNFNATLVKKYRLIGFDNRKTALNSSAPHIEGGEIGSGNSTLAIFQITPVTGTERTPHVEGGIAELQLNYQADNKTGRDSLHYFVPDNYITQDSLKQELKMATAVTMLGLKLRNSNFQGNITWPGLLQYSTAAINPEDYLQKEFLGQVIKAKEIYEPGKKKRKRW